MKNVRYEYWVDGPVIGIHDLHGEESVTVHAAGVLLEIENEIGSIEGKFVVWRDGDHIWDGLFFQDRHVNIYPLGCMTFEAAKEKLQNLSGRDREEYTFDGDSLTRAECSKNK
ncbi:hypothetical protein [Persicitalea sp.]|uniref:hypothetical protein n=1 Tax=Persicitalea sp. TaxID=3100273 RepID=UPI00359357B9